MNEARKIKCPLCGAPATVTESAHDFQAAAVYHYEEPDPAPASTVYGYDPDHLRVVAELLRRHGVTPEDLHDLKDNFQRAFDILHAEQERAHRAAIDRVLQNLTPGQVKIPPEPSEIVLRPCSGGARWKGAGMGYYTCSWCGQEVDETPPTCPRCKSEMDPPKRRFGE